MQFKKTLLATSALMSAMAWAPQAHAIPAFARQVGMPCSACHYQHFPTLNAFGRSFKAAGFTMVGSEEKIESTDGAGLSIPAVLNLAFVTNLAYTKTNGPSTANPNGGVNNAGNASSAINKGTNNGQFTMTQYSLFMGGRVSENIGFEGELGFAPATAGAGLASVKLPFSYDVGGGKLDIIPFTTSGLGAAQGFEALDTGASAVHLFNQQDMNAISAQQYMNTASPAYGAALVYYQDMGYANFTRWSPNTISGHGNAPAGVAGSSSAGAPTSNYLRLAWTPGNLIPGFDTGVGAQFWRGRSAVTGIDTAPNGGTILGGVYNTDATAVDAQMLGDVGGMPLTFIASYAQAPSTQGGAITAGLGNAGYVANTNYFNQGTATRKSFNVGAELGVIPNKATLQVGVRRADAGVAVNGSTNATDNAVMLGATYSLALNVRAELTYSMYSGDMYSVAAQQAAGNAYTGDRLLTLNLWMGF